MIAAVPAPARRALTRRARALVLGLGLGITLWTGRAFAEPPAEQDAAEAEPQPQVDEDSAEADDSAEPEADESAEPEAEPDPGDESSGDTPTEGESPDVEPAPEPDPDEPEPDDLGAIDDGPDEPSEEPSEDLDADAAPIRPPRFDGPYVGLVAMGTANFAKVIDLDTPAPLLGVGGFIQAGDAVFPWMSIGIAAGGQAGWVGRQQMYEGALLVEFGFVPVARYPLSIRAGFGFGGGAITEQGMDRRFGFGGALFKGSLRYEFFPLAERKRPARGGGWAIGPELGWLGATPAGKGQPFVNTILLGLSTSFYFGS